MLPQWGHEALHWHMFAARRALHAKSHRSRYTGFYIAAVLFWLLPHHFFSIAASFFLFKKKKIAAPRRTRVTNSTKICRTSLVARYAAPPCVTRYAATYIASTVTTGKLPYNWKELFHLHWAGKRNTKTKPCPTQTQSKHISTIRPQVLSDPRCESNLVPFRDNYYAPVCTRQCVDFVMKVKLTETKPSKRIIIIYPYTDHWH